MLELHCPWHLRSRQRGRDAHTSRLIEVVSIFVERADDFITLGSSPGNSVKEVGERMKGGAVREERSPEKEAILDNCAQIHVLSTCQQQLQESRAYDFKKLVQLPRWAAGTACGMR